MIERPRPPVKMYGPIGRAALHRKAQEEDRKRSGVAKQIISGSASEETVEKVRESLRTEKEMLEQERLIRKY